MSNLYKPNKKNIYKHNSAFQTTSGTFIDVTNLNSMLLIRTVQRYVLSYFVYCYSLSPANTQCEMRVMLPNPAEGRPNGVSTRLHEATASYFIRFGNDNIVSQFSTVMGQFYFVAFGTIEILPPITPLNQNTNDAGLLTIQIRNIQNNGNTVGCNNSWFSLQECL